jgi:hypothetical protein
MSFLARIFLLLVIFGGVILYVGIKEWRLSQAASPNPQTITCDQLEKKGPGNNLHVVLTDFILCEGSYVYQGSKNDNSRWTKVWIPAVPIDGEYVQQLKRMIAENKTSGEIPKPKNLKVIVKTSNVHSESELDDYAKHQTIQGLLVNKVESLGSEERNILAGSYPGIDFSNCYILEEGRKPKSAGTAAAMMGGGGLAILGGLFGMLRRMTSSG